MLARAAGKAASFDTSNSEQGETLTEPCNDLL
jgi:hypothetical protein